jgi:hypothetical protein
MNDSGLTKRDLDSLKPSLVMWDDLKTTNSLVHNLQRSNLENKNEVVRLAELTKSVRLKTI